MVDKFLWNHARSLVLPTFFPAEEKESSRDCIFLCDFDGTISIKDVTDTLLQQFGQAGCDELEEQWLAGTIGSQACMEGQIALLDASIDELDECLADIKIDEGFKAFIDEMNALEIPVHIVSDGLDYAIFRILQNNGMNGLSIFANHLHYMEDRKWRLDFPYANPACKKKSGNCKCSHISSLRPHFEQLLYVGDGASDFCVAHKVDVVLAKDKLIDYCQNKSIEYYSIEGFADVLSLLPELRPQLLPVREQAREMVYSGFAS